MKVSPEEFFNHQEKTRAHEAALRIRNDYDGYKLSCQFVGKDATIYFESRSMWDNRRKCIGTLIQNDNGALTYYKYGYVETEHKFKKSESLGVCWEILRNLIADDFIMIQEKTQKGIIKTYEISVRKANTFAVQENFMQFKEKGYERQLFIPKSAFKVYESKKIRRYA